MSRVMVDSVWTPLSQRTAWKGKGYISLRWNQALLEREKTLFDLLPSAQPRESNFKGTVAKNVFVFQFVYKQQCNVTWGAATNRPSY